ncbi:MAG TPA: hypothetical protein PLJ18_11530 [Niabella sp.]|nr:hypothetical protein [Bacteroidia bacterium]HOZ90988.1 hypothetical protein [Bacteroidia bacterium]HRB52087.1 hypothetical protein [Bacteroidia bacterium]HRC03077.1 hypothetical protein [Niabella sp.]
MEIFVKLKDASNSHSILHQQKNLFGKKVEKVLKDVYVSKLLKDGVIVEAKETEYDAWVKSNPVEVSAEEKAIEDNKVSEKSEVEKTEETTADETFVDLAEKFIDQGIVTKDSKGYKLESEYIGKKKNDVAKSLSELPAEKLEELKALLD